MSLRQGPNDLLKALTSAQTVLLMIANCHRCDHCRRRALDCLGYQVNPVLDQKPNFVTPKKRKYKRRARSAAKETIQSANEQISQPVETVEGSVANQRTPK